MHTRARTKRCIAGLAALVAILIDGEVIAQTAAPAPEAAATPSAQPQDKDKKAQAAKKPAKPKPKNTTKSPPAKAAPPGGKPAPTAPAQAAPVQPKSAGATPVIPAQPHPAAAAQIAPVQPPPAAATQPPPIQAESAASSTPAVPPEKPRAELIGVPAVDAAPTDSPGKARLLLPVATTIPGDADGTEGVSAPAASPGLIAAGASDPPAASAQAAPAAGKQGSVTPPSGGPASEDSARAPSADAAAASAKEKQEVEVLRQTTMQLIRLLVESGILTQEKADALIRDAKQSAAQATAAQAQAESKVVRVPYVPQFMRDQMTEEVKQQVIAQAKEERWALPNAIPEWVDRFTFFGDFRLRYQWNGLSPDNGQYVDVNATNTGQGLELLNTTQSYDYWRYQLRLGTNVRVADGVLVGASLSSGNTGNPVSLNQTLGTGFNKNSVVLDTAYIRFDPAQWATIWGGRFPNPFFFTDLVWYDQLNFDGIATTLRAPIDRRSMGWLTLGAFPVQNIDCTDAIALTCGENKWLFGGQGVYQTRLAGDHRLTAGLAYYYWYNYQGQFNSPTVNPEDPTFVPRFAQKGNTYFNIVTSGGNPLLGLAPQYHEVNLTASLDLGYWDPVRTILTGDIVKNIGYNQQQIFQQTGGLVNQSPRTLGWYVRLLVGKPLLEGWGDWQAWAGYKYVERDSVVDGYNDPDFHFGGTDAKGYLIGLSVAVAKNTFARLRWYSANAIDGAPLAWDVLQFDVGARF